MTQQASNTIESARIRLEQIRDLIEEHDPCAMSLAGSMVQIALQETSAHIEHLAQSCPTAQIPTAELQEYAHSLQRFCTDVQSLTEVMHEDYHDQLDQED